MKKSLIIIIGILPFLQSFRCGKSNDYYNVEIPTVKLKSSLNNSNETIRLGDTLKFSLIIPDTLDVISKIDGSVTRVPISTLQLCIYGFTFYSIDTILKRGIRITDINHAFVSIGTSNNAGSIYTSTANKPFKSTLNIVPPATGLYYVEFGSQETRIQVNSTLNGGLRMNMDVSNKHWYLIDPFFPGTTTAALSNDLQGYGYYCFRVN